MMARNQFRNQVDSLAFQVDRMTFQVDSIPLQVVQN